MQKNLNISSIPLHDLQERTFFMLSSLIVLSVSLYIYFMSATVLRVVDRTSALSEAKILDTKISELESEYMASGSMIDLSEAKLSGYEEIAKVDYVSRNASLGFAKR